MFSSFGYCALAVFPIGLLVVVIALRLTPKTPERQDERILFTAFGLSSSASVSFLCGWIDAIKQIQLHDPTYVGKAWPVYVLAALILSAMFTHHWFMQARRARLGIKPVADTTGDLRENAYRKMRNQRP